MATFIVFQRVSNAAPSASPTRTARRGVAAGYNGPGPSQGVQDSIDTLDEDEKVKETKKNWSDMDQIL